MTLAEFLRYLKSQDCDYSPLEGINISGNAIKITCKRTNRRHILTLYHGADPTDETIKSVCDDLLISYPKHLL